MGLTRSLTKSLSKYRRKGLPAGLDTTHAAVADDAQTTEALGEQSTTARHQSVSPLRRKLFRALRLHTDKHTDISSTSPSGRHSSLIPHDPLTTSASDSPVLQTQPLGSIQGVSGSEAPVSSIIPDQGPTFDLANGNSHSNNVHEVIQTTNQRLSPHGLEAPHLERIEEDVTDEQQVDLPHTEKRDPIPAVFVEGSSNPPGDQSHIPETTEEGVATSSSPLYGYSNTSASQPGNREHSSVHPSPSLSIPNPPALGSRPERHGPPPSPGTLVVVQGLISSRRVDPSPIVPSNSPLPTSDALSTDDTSAQPSTTSNVAPMPLSSVSPFVAHPYSSDRASHRRSLTQTARQLISSTFRRRSMVQPSVGLSESHPTTAPDPPTASSSPSPQNLQPPVTSSESTSAQATSLPILNAVGGETARSDNDAGAAGSDNLDVLGSIVSIATAATAASLILDETRSASTSPRSRSSAPSGLNLNMLSIAQALLSANAAIPTIFRPDMDHSSRMRPPVEPESLLNPFGSLGGPFFGFGREREPFRSSTSMPSVDAGTTHSLLGGLISHLPNIIGGQTAQRSPEPNSIPTNLGMPNRRESNNLSDLPQSHARPSESEASSSETFSQFLSGVQSDIRFVFSEMDNTSGVEPGSHTSTDRPSNSSGVTESTPVGQLPAQTNEGASNSSPATTRVRDANGVSGEGTLHDATEANPDGAQRAGINNWRVHRFAPMPVSRISPNNARGSISGSDDRDTPDLMIPVVFVGLQRIRPEARDSTSDIPPAVFSPNNPIQTLGSQNHTNTSVPTEDIPDAPAPWTTNPSSDRTTSRAFFIYIYGGFFPADHPVVTGSGNLDSFEALWELIDWLGQMKSPVVTQEDINKSGLVTFKAKDFPTKQKNEEVSDNCVDKCLVCLEDYAPEDDVRLLTCRHAFHTACVDTWLQTGKNNCPACRAPGVSSSGRGSIPPL